MLNIGVLSKYKKITSQKILVGVFVFFISLFLGSLFSSQQASATKLDLSPADQIRSYSNYNALTQCIRMGQWENRITDADATSPTKWLGTDTISVGYIVDSTDGLRQCNNIIKSGLDLWGFSGSYKAALQSFGYTQSELTGSDWIKPSGGVLFDKFQSTIKNAVYDGATPTLEGRPDLLYLRGQSHLESSAACSASPYKKVSDLTPDEKSKYKNNDQAETSSSNPTGLKDYLIVKLVNGTNFQTEDWVYKIPTNKWAQSIKLNEAPSGGSVEPTCVNIARDMAGYADRVRADILAMQTAEQDVGAKYAGILVTPGGAGAIPGDQTGADGGTSTASSCVVEGVGWIVCPVMTFMGGIVDGAYNFVSGLLKVKPLMTTGDNSGAYQAWSVMRNIANVAFVIAFLVIIFSQLTSIGISNYGVKKLLPRIAVAAILVNVSFWICAIGIDLSNIAGASMVQIFDSVGADIGTNLNRSIGESGTPLDGSNVWTNLVGGVLAGGLGAAVIYYVQLSALIPALLAALVAIITVFLVLTLRQALIILLIVVAPLAFVAYLLPNTENLFNKWRKLFMTLLLMYPIIAALFGVSALASQIIQASSNDAIVQIMAACIAILPLALTPLVMKTAGGVLNRFGGIVNNKERGPVDRLRKAGAGYRETRKGIRDNKAFEGARQGGRGAFVRWRAKRGAIAAGVKNQRGRTEQQYLANSMTDEDGTATSFAKRVAGGTSSYDRSTGSFSVTADPAALQRALAGAKFTIEKAEMEDVKAAHSEIDGLDKNDLRTIINNADGAQPSASIAAAIERYVKIADTKEIGEVANQHAIGGKSTLITKVLANSLAQDGSQALKAPDIDNIARGQMGFDPDKNRTRATFEEVLTNNVSGRVWSQEKMVSGSNDDLKYSFDIADTAGKEAMRTRAKELISNPTLVGKIKHNEKTIYDIAGLPQPGSRSAPNGPTGSPPPTSPSGGSQPPQANQGASMPMPAGAQPTGGTTRQPSTPSYTYSPATPTTAPSSTSTSTPSSTPQAATTYVAAPPAAPTIRNVPQSSAQTIITVDHSGDSSASTIAAPQPARESQDQAKAEVIARARQQAAQATQQSTSSANGFNIQQPPKPRDFRNRTPK